MSFDDSADKLRKYKELKIIEKILSYLRRFKSIFQFPKNLYVCSMYIKAILKREHFEFQEKRYDNHLLHFAHQNI